MLTAPEIEGRSLSLLLIAEDDEMAVVTGLVRVREEQLVFEHGGDPSSFRLPEDSLERIKRINKDDETLVEIFGDAEFMLPLTVGNLPSDALSDDSEPTGLRWPKE